MVPRAERAPPNDAKRRRQRCHHRNDVFSIPKQHQNGVIKNARRTMPTTTPKRRQNDPQMTLRRRCRLEEISPKTAPTLKRCRQCRNSDTKKSKGAKRRISNCLKRLQNDASPGSDAGNACSAFSDHQNGATPSASH